MLLDNNFDVIRKVGNREVPRNIEMSKKKIFGVILDGTVTGTLVKTCEEFGISYLGATNFGNVKDTKLKLVSL